MVLWSIMMLRLIQFYNPNKKGGQMQKFPLKYEDIDLYFDPVKHVYKVNGKNVRL